MTPDEDTFARIDEDDSWIEETAVTKIKGIGDAHTTISTTIINGQTVMVCPKCGTHNRLNNEKCVKCDYGLI